MMQKFYVFLPIVFIFIAYYYSYSKKCLNLEFENVQSLNLMIGIMSSRANFDHRNAIRNSWLSNISSVGNIGVKFVIGNSCPIPLEDRWNINSCNFWNVRLPETNKTQWTCQLEDSIFKPKTAYKGFSVKIRHPIIVTKLGVLETVFRFNNTATVMLLNSVSEDVIVKVHFTPVKIGVAIAGYQYLPIDPIILPKDFEATIILETEISEGLLINKQQIWNTAHNVFSFTRVFHTDYVSRKWSFDKLSTVTFGFSIYGLKNHIDKISERQQQWNNQLYQESLKIEKELSTYNDILITDVVDSYSNLPLKLIQFYKLTAENYNVEFVMKTDDDVILDVPRIVRELKILKSTHCSLDKIWWSRFRFNWAVNRVGKWAELEYESISYPPFACGLGNIISNDLLQWLARNSEELHPYQGEDVSLGIWLSAIGPNHINDFRWQCDSGCTNNSFNMGQLTPLEIQNAWSAMQKCYNICGCY